MDSVEIITQVEKVKFMFRVGFPADGIKGLKRLEESGSGSAAHFLSVIYDSGFDCDFIDRVRGYGRRDEALAKYYLMKAIERESSGAQFEMACAYYYGNEKESGIKKEKDYSKCYKWASLCVDSQEYSEVSFMAMSLLSELYAKGLGCKKNYYHAVLLRCIADLYNSHQKHEFEYVDRSFDVPDKLGALAYVMSLTYFSIIQDEGVKSPLASSFSTIPQMFFESVIKKGLN